MRVGASDNVAALPELAAVFDGVELRHRASRPGAKDRRPSGVGWMTDTKARRAVERRAVDWTLDYLSERGYQVEDVGARSSYDIRAHLEGEEIHVEVKGTTSQAKTIELPVNEVPKNDGRGHLLVVVDQINCSLNGKRLVTEHAAPRLDVLSIFFPPRFFGRRVGWSAAWGELRV